LAEGIEESGDGSLETGVKDKKKKLKEVKDRRTKNKVKVVEYLPHITTESKPVVS